MNKKTQIRLKAIAVKLPPSCHEVYTQVRMTGAEMIEKGVPLQGGGEIDPKGLYIKKVMDLDHYNHFRKLKKYYTKFGQVEFLDKYLKDFAEHHALMMTKYPGVFKKPVDDNNDVKRVLQSTN